MAQKERITATSYCRHKGCNQPVEYVLCKDPFWRHTEPNQDPPHGAVPGIIQRPVDRPFR